VQISAQVAAAIVDVPVTDNQLVDAGAGLVRLDDRDYVAQRDQAQAQVNQAQASVDNLTAQIAAQQAKIDQANKQVTQAQAALTFARQQAERYQQLASKGSGTVEQAQQYVSNQQQNEAGLAAAQKQIGVLQAQRDLAYGQLAQAHATLEQSQANLARTIVTAPVAGRVTRLTAAKGGYAAVGQALMMFVPREVWVTANFKETQLNLMRPGQPVEIAIDAYPGRTFAGHVDSVQSGSGTAFSLLPAENATGNYVKIVQRVPVKITFDKMPDILLGPGMSVVPTVKVR
jgi:membrane fusion protein, multidrug efflux system